MSDFVCLQGTNTSGFSGFRACRCLDRFTRIEMFGNCTPCKDETGIDCVHDMNNLTRGFWWFWRNKTRQEWYAKFTDNLGNESFTPELHIKDNPDIFFPHPLPIPHRCPLREACHGGARSTCKEGHKGPVCAVCKDGYYKQLRKCKPCPTKGLMIGQFSIMGAIVILLVILVVWRSKKKSKKSAGRSFVDIVLGRVKVVVGFYQVTYGLMEAFAYIRWPDSLSVIGEVSEMVQVNVLQIAPLHCVLPSLKFDAFVSLFAVMGLNVAAVIVALASFFLVTWASTRNILSEEEKMKKKKHIKVVVMRNLFFFLYVTYLNTCIKTAQVMPLACRTICIDKEDEENKTCVDYLKADYTIWCKEKRYNQLVNVGYCCIVYVIVLPTTAFTIICKQKWAAKKTGGETTNHTNGSEDQSTVQTALRFLHENFIPSCWFWEIIETIRKVTLTSGLILVGSESRAYVGSAVLFSGLYGMYFATKKPIIDPFENKLMLSSLAVTFVNLGIGSVSTIPSEGDPNSAEPYMHNIVFNSLVLAANSLVIGLLVGKLRTYIVLSIIQFLVSVPGLYLEEHPYL